MPSFALFFRGWDTLTGNFAFGAVCYPGLFAHCFPANPFLAGLANPAFDYLGWLSADHALFARFVRHGNFLAKLSVVKPLVNHPYLLGILDDNLQAVLGMVFDLTGNLDVLVLVTPGRRLGFIE